MLAVFAVFAFVLAAGCVNPPAPVTSDDPVLAIQIEKTGVTYNIGDTMDVILPSNPTTGYQWAVKSNDDGIEVTEGDYEAPAADGMVGVGGFQMFVVKAVKEGNYSFTLVYKRANDEAGIYEYTDVLHVKKSDEPVMEHRGVFKFMGNSYTASIGQKVTVSIAGNPTTGYQWVAQETPGLTVSEPDYQQNDAPEGMAGVPGVYTWTITSDTPGAYYFTAYYQRSWENAEPASRIIVPICFSME